MRFTILTLAMLFTLLLTAACGVRETPSEKHEDANSPAGKLGQAAHKIAVQANKAGAAVARDLSKAAHDAHEGWKEEKRKSRAKQGK